MAAEALALLLGQALLGAAKGLPPAVRRQLAQALLQDTDEAAADAHRQAEEVSAREAAWTTPPPAPAAAVPVAGFAPTTTIPTPPTAEATGERRTTQPLPVVELPGTPRGGGT